MLNPGGQAEVVAVALAKDGRDAAVGIHPVYGDSAFTVTITRSDGTVVTLQVRLAGQHVPTPG